MEPGRQAWLKSERARHGEFVQALRDAARAPDVLGAAHDELSRWEDQKSRPADEIDGWRAILALPAGHIATLLEEQSHPLLQKQWGESPFTRALTDEEIEASRQRMLDRLLHRGDFARPGSTRRSKCQLSLVNERGERYCLLMSHPDFSHPGELVRQQCLERFELSVTEGARVLGVSRQALTNLITGKAGISPEMALRLDVAFGGGAETWLQRQLLHDLAQARKRLAELNVVPVASERQPALF
jgi:addiction module HigA family antidote